MNNARPRASSTEKHSAARVLRDKAELVWAALREIFDESAYARFLARRRMTSSSQAYAAFLREHELAKARRIRCC
jgi:hypothetical protein